MFCLALLLGASWTITRLTSTYAAPAQLDSPAIFVKVTKFHDDHVAPSDPSLSNSNFTIKRAKNFTTAISNEHLSLSKRIQIELTSNASSTNLQPTETYLITLNNIRTLTYPKCLYAASAILEFCYEAIAFFIIDHEHDLIEQHDLIFQIGALTFSFHSMAKYISLQAVRAVVRRLGQMVQMGLTGLVSGQVVDVKAETRMLFAFGIVNLDLFGNFE